MKVDFRTIVEILVLLMMGCAVFCRPRGIDESVRRFEHTMRRFARRKLLACLTVGAATLLVRAALLPVWHIPHPAIHDEFSYLLGADTFASGRLTNPQHPLWQFFESPHILVRPSYQTIYPPAQSIVLAAGQVLLGNPWFGAWLSCGIMVASICWMLQGWVPPGWALIGALCAMTGLGIASYWMNSYWGGAVAATGGCLTMGAYPRITRRHQIAHSWTFCIGLIVLANSRPYEGAIASVPLVIGLLWYLGQQPVSRIARFAVPALVCLVSAGLCMGHYNARVTGNPLSMPHVEHGRQYSMVPFLMFLPIPLPKSYRHDDLRFQYAVWEMNELHKQRNQFLQTRLRELWTADQTFLGLILTAPLIFSLAVLRDRRIHMLLFCLLATIAATAIGEGFKAHYLAPATGCIFALLVQCMRHLRSARFPGRAAGRLIVTLIPFGAAFAVIVTQSVALRLQEPWDPLSAPVRKALVEAQLLRSGPKQLVFVNYHLSGTQAYGEWVYNPADIDQAPVIWAQDMGPAENQKLLAYYPDRRAWLFEPNALPPRLKVYR
jgi:hypothetical protein